MEHVQWDKTNFHDLKIDLLNVFREVVKFTDDTIFTVQPQHDFFVKTFGTQDKPFMFQNPYRHEISESKNVMVYKVQYETYTWEFSELSIYYNIKEKSILIRIENGEHEEFLVPHEIWYCPNNPRVFDLDNFVFKNYEDFMFLFKKWLYLDHNETDTFFPTFRQICTEYFNDQ